VQDGGLILTGLDGIAREATLLAAILFFLGGLDELVVDWIHISNRLRKRVYKAKSEPVFDNNPLGRMAIFIPAWDEAAVIGAMLRAALRRFDHSDYVIYVGTYPNDPATICAVREVADADRRVRLVVGEKPGGTTKADCLNTLWRALLRDEANGEPPVAAVVLHDAEDVVHPLELRVFDRFLRDNAAVQIPVMPLQVPGSPCVSGHYLDEFAEAHGRTLPVRQLVGAGLPFAGTGCAIRRDMLGRIADLHGGNPFDAGSLTEDYELGLKIDGAGGRILFAWIPEVPGGPPVAVRAYFPSQFGAAVRQKARWMTGIALVGWDRTGWSRAGHIADHWMRLRDRRAALAMPVLAVAYGALLLWSISLSAHAMLDDEGPEWPPGLAWFIWANLILLGWRLVMRVATVTRLYGWRQARWAPLRMLTGNLIALFAARDAFRDYLFYVAGREPRWQKTAHRFPDQIPTDH
jgi:bacteriophage N4 adsorption protein B